MDVGWFSSSSSFSSGRIWIEAGSLRWDSTPWGCAGCRAIRSPSSLGCPTDGRGGGGRPLRPACWSTAAWRSGWALPAPAVASSPTSGRRTPGAWCRGRRGNCSRRGGPGEPPPFPTPCSCRQSRRSPTKLLEFSPAFKQRIWVNNRMNEWRNNDKFRGDLFKF